MNEIPKWTLVLGSFLQKSRKYILQPKTGEGMMKIEGMTFIFEHFFRAKMRVKELETQKETH